MEPHQERVIAEKRDLDEKLVKLTVFITEDRVFRGLPEADKGLLREQQLIMEHFSQVLAARIARFDRGVESAMRMQDGELRMMTQEKQSPTIGRVVLFWPPEGDGAKLADEYVAIIGEVFNDGVNPRPYCNLLTFPPFQKPKWEGSVQERDDQDTDHTAAPSRTWRWPPRA